MALTHGGSHRAPAGLGTSPLVAGTWHCWLVVSRIKCLFLARLDSQGCWLWGFVPFLGVLRHSGCCHCLPRLCSWKPAWVSWCRQRGAWVGEGAGMGCPTGRNLSSACSIWGDLVTVVTGRGWLWVMQISRGRHPRKHHFDAPWRGRGVHRALCLHSQSFPGAASCRTNPCKRNKTPSK